MHKKTRRRPLLVASITALFALLIGLPPAYAQNVNSCPHTLQVIGLTNDGRLVRFTAGSPQATTAIGSVTGLQNQDTALIGIQFRVQDGLLYEVRNGGVTVQNCGFAALTAGNTSDFSPINLLTGKATSVGGFTTSVVDIALPINQY